MRWSAEEALRRALPYGYWRWTDPDGAVVETLINRRSKPLATRVDGLRIGEVREPPAWMRGHEYFFHDSDSPWRNRATRDRVSTIARDWGLDPEALAAAAARAIREEERRRRGRASEQELARQ